MTPEEKRTALERFYADRAVDRRRGERLDVVHYRLDAAHLANFAAPRPWLEIVDLEPVLGPRFWRAGIVDAENRGFMRWVRARERGEKRGAWTLTALGREYVERHRR